MTTHYTLVLQLIGIAALSGCFEQGSSQLGSQRSRVVTADDPDILSVSKRYESLENTIGILESDYLKKFEEGQFAAADEKHRDLQIALGARANAQGALGVVGRSEQGVSLDGRRVIVLHNPREADEKRQQATAFSVVNGALFGEVEMALVDLELHFGSEPGKPCARAFRGCSVLTASDMRPSAFTNWDFGGMGFPPGVRLDAESAEVPQNQTGHTIELWNIPNPDVAKMLWPEQTFVGNRFACAEPLQEELARECDLQSQGDAPQASANEELALGERVFMVTEADFQAALLSGAFSELKPESDLTFRAASIATALNEADSRDVQANYLKIEAIEADVLLVAKSPRLEKERLSADRLFVVPGPIRMDTPSGLVGFNPVIHGIDSSHFSMGFCGPVIFPSVELEPGSPGLPEPLSVEQAGYGTDRKAHGLSRRTMRVPVMHQGRQSIQMIACSRYEPPRPNPPPIVTPQYRYEVCNGVDDTGDGRVDEGTCSLSACTSCVPVSDCGPRQCVSAPDGCGGLLDCPCP